MWPENVRGLDGHVLLVTDAYESQATTPLSGRDLGALFKAVVEVIRTTDR